MRLKGEVVTNIAKQSETKFSVMELSGGNGWKKAETAANPQVVVEEFFAWQLAEEAFEYAVIVAASSNASFVKLLKKETPLPSVCLGETIAKDHCSFLVEHALKGFEIIVATKATEEDCDRFFAKFGYAKCNSGAADSDAAMINAAWNKKELGAAIDVAFKLGGNVFCCFAHDADPVYILRPDSP